MKKSILIATLTCFGSVLSGVDSPLWEVSTAYACPDGEDCDSQEQDEEGWAEDEDQDWGKDDGKSEDGDQDEDQFRNWDQDEEENDFEEECEENPRDCC